MTERNCQGSAIDLCLLQAELEGQAEPAFATGAPEVKFVQERNVWPDCISWSSHWRCFWARYWTCANSSKVCFLGFPDLSGYLHFVHFCDLANRIEKFKCHFVCEASHLHSSVRGFCWCCGLVPVVCVCLLVSGLVCFLFLQNPGKLHELNGCFLSAELRGVFYLA